MTYEKIDLFKLIIGHLSKNVSNKFNGYQTFLFEAVKGRADQGRVG